MVDLRNKKHIFFDLDNTLWDFDKNSAAVLAELFEEFSLGAKLNTGLSEFIGHYRDVNLALWSKYYKREIDKKFLREERFNHVFSKYGYTNHEENLELTGHYIQRAPKGTCLKENCIETLDYLKTRYQLHIITNGFKEIQHIKIDGCGLRNYFSNIIISEEYGLVKPEEQIFRLAEQFAGTDKNSCVMVGDSLESDVEGALNAGWEAIYFADHQPRNYQGHLISNLCELRNFF